MPPPPSPPQGGRSCPPPPPLPPRGQPVCLWCGLQTPHPHPQQTPTAQNPPPAPPIPPKVCRGEVVPWHADECMRHVPAMPGPLRGPPTRGTVGTKRGDVRSLRRDVCLPGISSSASRSGRRPPSCTAGQERAIGDGCAPRRPGNGRRTSRRQRGRRRSGAPAPTGPGKSQTIVLDTDALCPRRQEAPGAPERLTPVAAAAQRAQGSRRPVPEKGGGRKESHAQWQKRLLAVGRAVGDRKRGGHKAVVVRDAP